MTRSDMSFTKRSSSAAAVAGGARAGLLSALNAAAAAIQRSARSERDVFVAVETELAALGLRGGLALIDPIAGHLEVRAAWLPTEALGVAVSHDRPQAPRDALARVPGYEAFLGRGVTIFVDDGAKLIADHVAATAPALAKLAAQVVHDAPALVAAIRSDDGVRGALAIVDDQLVPADADAVEAFANHLAIALDNANLVAELRAVNERLAAELVEHERAEAALRQSEAQFRGAFDNVAVGVMLVAVDGRIMRVNTTLVEMLGYREDELTTKTFNDITHPADVDVGVHLLARLLAGEVEHARIEKRYRHRDGHLVWVVVSPSLLRDERGKPLFIVSQVQDITDQKRAEDALRRSEREARVLLDAAEDLVMLIEPNGVLLAANSELEERFGVRVEEAVGQNVFELMPADVAERRRAAGDLCASTRQPVTFRDERANRILDNRIVPIFDENDVVNELAVFSRDVTVQLRNELERRDMDRRMRDAQKNESLALLAGGVAHDFNNLLVGILGNIELAQLQLSDEHATQRNLEAARAAGDRAADLCKQMLAYSGRSSLVTEVVDVSAVIEDMKQLLTSSCSRPGVLSFELGSELPGVRTDITQLRQVIMNLVTNASEAVEAAEGRVVVRTGWKDCAASDFERALPEGEHPAGRYVYVEVEDTGSGMEADTVARMFDPFFSTKFAGRGLGLAALLGIVRAHDGAVMVDSEPGVGTKVQVALPARAEAAPRAPVSSRSADAWRGTGTILVVDDEPTVQKVARALLTNLGFEVQVACDGQEALAIFERSADEIGCVLLDYTMPDMNGAEVLARLRRQRPDLPVVLASGFGKEGLSAELTDAGPVELLSKPYDLRDLTAALRRVLGT